MSAQTEIIAAVAECQYSSIINALEYFYQWAVKFDDRHKFTITSHRDQEQFNVCVVIRIHHHTFNDRRIWCWRTYEISSKHIWTTL
jgi:hypothetical protein